MLHYVVRGAMRGLAGGLVLYIADKVEGQLAGRSLPFRPEQIAIHKFGLKGRAAKSAGLVMRAFYSAAWGLAFERARRSVASPAVSTPVRFSALIFVTELLVMPRLQLVPRLSKWQLSTFPWLAIHTFAFAKSQYYRNPALQTKSSGLTTDLRLGICTTNAEHPAPLETRIRMKTQHTKEIVVITGASAGVGRATARLFARHGATVALLARGSQGLDEARKEVEGLGAKALAIPTDVAHFEEVQAAAEQVERELGPINIWVNNAMATIFAPLKHIEADEFKRATEVTYLGSVWGTKCALSYMIPRNCGTIVQVGSALAYRSIPLQSPYCGAKHGLVGFFDSLRSELIHDKSKIVLTMVHMPALNTPQFTWARSRMPRHPQPVPPIYEPEVAADAIYWAAHHQQRELYVGLPTCEAIWGQKFIPGLLDWYLSKRAYSAQETNMPVQADRPDNLYSPVAGDFGAHGIFDAKSKKHSPALWLSKHKWAVAAGLLATSAGLALASQRMSRNSYG